MVAPSIVQRGARGAWIASRRAVVARRVVVGPRRPGWSVDLETALGLTRGVVKLVRFLPPGVPFPNLELLATPRRDPARVGERVDAGGVPGEWFRREDKRHDGVLLYLHGGGYTVGSIDTHRLLIGRLTKAFGGRALAIDYRLAPRHRFPAQLEDALAAYRWLLGTGVPAARIVLAGDSAGGGLTMSTLVALRDAGDPLPAGAVGISPWVDLEARGRSMRTNDRYDYIGREAVRQSASLFVRRRDRRNPLAAPIHAELGGLPPLLIQVGGAETLLDDGRRLAARASAAGVEVELDVEPHMPHVWHVWHPLVPDEARAGIQRAGAFLERRATAGP